MCSVSTVWGGGGISWSYFLSVHYCLGGRVGVAPSRTHRSLVGDLFQGGVWLEEFN